MPTFKLRILFLSSLHSWELRECNLTLGRFLDMIDVFEF